MNKNILKIIFVMVLMLSFSGVVFGDTLASCEYVTGYDYFNISDSYQTFSLNDTAIISWVEVNARNFESFNTLLTFNLYDNSTNTLIYSESKTITKDFFIYEFAKNENLMLTSGVYRIEFEGINSIQFLEAIENDLGDDCYTLGSVYNSLGVDADFDLLFRVIGTYTTLQNTLLFNNLREDTTYVNQFYDDWELLDYFYLPFDAYLSDTSVYWKSNYGDLNTYKNYFIYVDRLNDTCSNNISNTSKINTCWNNVYGFWNSPSPQNENYIILKQTESYIGDINAEVGYLYNLTLNLSEVENFTLNGGDYYRLRWNIKYAGGNYNNGYYMTDDLTNNPIQYTYFLGSGKLDVNPSNTITFNEDLGYYSNMKVRLLNACSGVYCDEIDEVYPTTTNETEITPLTVKGDRLEKGEIDVLISIFENAGTNEEGETNSFTLMGIIATLILTGGIVFMFYSVNSESTFYLGSIMFRGLLLCVVVGILPMVIPLLILVFMIFGFMINLFLGGNKE